MMILVLKTNEGIVVSEFKNVEKLDLDSDATISGKEDKNILLSWLASNIKKGGWLNQKPKR